MGAENKREFSTRDRWLAFSLLLGPASWVLHLNVSYMLVPESCDRGSKLMLHVVTIACIGLALVAAAIAWRIRMQCIDEASPELWKDRTRWVATMATILSLFIVVVIVAQQIPNFMLRSCD